MTPSRRNGANSSRDIPERWRTRASHISTKSRALERSRDAIDAELGEAERAKPDDREDERAHEQNLARRLHETRLPGSRRLEPTARPR